MLQGIASKCLELPTAWRLRKCAKCCESMRNVVNVEKLWESVLNVEKVQENALSVEKVWESVIVLRKNEKVC